MPPLRSRTVTHGRNMAGARALLRATGLAREDIGKPVSAALQVYSVMATSVSTGAARDITLTVYADR
jgi:dihydroxyacid dehydratase/phosphogluconate dehydratase